MSFVLSLNTIPYYVFTHFLIYTKGAFWWLDEVIEGSSSEVPPFKYFLKYCIRVIFLDIYRLLLPSDTLKVKRALSSSA